MGGDFAPEVAVKGAVKALDALGSDSRIVLYGDAEAIRALLAKEGVAEDRFDIVATSEVIEMGDHPVRAFQQKRDSSIVVGFQHLADGEINGFASAGSTGAIMVGSTQTVKVLEGVIRPAISTVVPTITGAPVMLLDIGLNVDCRPDILEQYALIGSIYAESVLGVEKPRVALLNIGTEASKGNLQTKAAYELMQVGGETGSYNFVGNVEASQIFTSKVADVVVCDGFVGNTILKLTEGFYSINTSIGTTNTFWEGMNYENMILSTEQAIRVNIVARLSEAFKK